MPYIKEPDFVELCVLIENVEEAHNTDTTIERMINKAQNILKRYKKRE